MPLSLRSELQQSLNRAAQPSYIPRIKVFFKEPVNPIGLARPITRKIVNEFYKSHKQELSFSQVLSLTETMLKTGKHEYCEAALFLVEKYKKEYSKETFPVFERWLSKYTDNWALVDTLAPSGIGLLIQTYPKLFSKIKLWTKSKNRWLRRASVVSFTSIARRTDYTKQVTALVSELLSDKDDLVQKACGWTLRESAKANKPAILKFLRTHKQKMPRTMLRYSIERFNKKEKKEMMGK